MTTAAVLRHPDAKFELENLELPGLGPQEVLVRIAATGMCHSDLLARTTPAKDFRPIVFGHEGAGVVVEVGHLVRRVTPGDHVVLSYDSCGWCRCCRSGDVSYCRDFVDINSTGYGLPGAPVARDVRGRLVGSRFFAQSSFARHSIVTERSAVRVPRDLDLARLGPLGCGFQTGAGAILRAMRPRTDDAVAVFGAGAVGLAAVMAANAIGVTTIVAVDLKPSRLSLAAELGATIMIDGADPDLSTLLRSATGGIRFGLDTTGNSMVVQAALSSLDQRGTLALVGATPVDVRLSPIELMGRTITYLIEGSADPHQMVPALIDLWSAGRFPFDRLLQLYPFDRINDAERDSLSGDTVKPVLVMDS